MIRPEMASETKTDAELMTVPAAARRLGITAKVLRRSVRSGALPTYTAGGSWPRVRPADLAAFVASTRVAPRENARSVAASMTDRANAREAHNTGP